MPDGRIDGAGKPVRQPRGLVGRNEHIAVEGRTTKQGQRSLGLQLGSSWQRRHRIHHLPAAALRPNIQPDVTNGRVVGNQGGKADARLTRHRRYGNARHHGGESLDALAHGNSGLARGLARLHDGRRKTCDINLLAIGRQQEFGLGAGIERRLSGHDIGIFVTAEFHAVARYTHALIGQFKTAAGARRGEERLPGLFRLFVFPETERKGTAIGGLSRRCGDDAIQIDLDGMLIRHDADAKAHAAIGIIRFAA